MFFVIVLAPGNIEICVREACAEDQQSEDRILADPHK